MFNDNVISIGSRKPLAVEQAEEAILVEEAEKAQAAALTQHQEVCLKMLDEMRVLVEKGRLQGLVIVGRDPTSGLFMTEVAMSRAVTEPSQLFGYVGAIETIKLELVEAASFAPTLLTSGEVIDPWAEATADDLEDDE